ncbi:MAG: hypothetical protein ABSF50_16085 [Burkholderiaceae bacterium]|jgi:hypothetical protein
MNWSQYGPAVIAAFIMVTLIDALTAAVYGRKSAMESDLVRAAVHAHPFRFFMISRIGAAITCVSFLFFCGFFGLTSLVPAIMFAVGGWLAVAAPLIGMAALYLKLGTATVVLQALAWLVRLLACAGAAYYFL